MLELAIDKVGLVTSAFSCRGAFLEADFKRLGTGIPNITTKGLETALI